MTVMQTCAKNDETARSSKERENIIEVADLRFVYSQKTPFEKAAVNGVSFGIKKGEYIAIIGHTGSGKSTLIQMLNGLIRPTSGTVKLNGEDIWGKKSDIRSVRFRVGLCFQYPEYQLFEETVYADIAYGPKNKGLSGDELDRAVREAAEFAGLTEQHLKQSPFELSGGEKRRAAIAGVIAMKPEVLILDEPTAGLDPRGRETILEGIREYRRVTGSTIVLVTHSMEDAAANADRLLVMNGGKVEYFDVPAAVFSHADRLGEIGLGLPQTSRVIMRLRELGYALPADVFTVSEAKRLLIPFLRRAGDKDA